MNYAIIGPGKLGRHLAHFFKIKKLNFEIFNRSSDFSKLENFDCILLATNDSEIEKAYLKYEKYHHKIWFHFSGAQYFDKIIGLHPMMSFSDELFSNDFYDQIRWVLDRDIDITQYFPVNLSQVSTIDKKDKSYYHALCVLSGNIPHLIWSNLEKEFLKLNINKTDFLNYIKVTTDNYLKDRPATGPIVRNDLKTIDQNLNSLNIPYQKIYQGILEIQNENNSGF